MIDPKIFLQALIKADIRFFTGVPDSLLKDICACFSEELPDKSHIIATNEGSALSLGIGHYLSSSRPALIYLQNSGLGNIINPLTSLAHKKIYSIPALLLIGWRAEILENGEQKKDEPQHIVQGAITLEQLKLMNIDYKIIDQNTTDIQELILDITKKVLFHQSPFAIVVRRNTFSKFSRKIVNKNPNCLKREHIIEIILNNISRDTIVVSTTGMASREVFEMREAMGHDHSNDFLTVGGMGHASQIASGIALENPNRKVVCIDGDGALLMHTGGLAISSRCNNLLHVLINNCAHESVGGQPTMADSIKLSDLAKTFGYINSNTISTYDEIKDIFKKKNLFYQSTFVEVISSLGSRDDLGRPTSTPVENKISIMRLLSKNV